MQLRFVEIFCSVVEERSFSQGARAQGVTQSAASQAVSALEKRLGVQLIDRTKRPFELTVAGQTYFDGCKTLLTEYRTIEDRVRGAANLLVGKVRVAAITSVGLLQMGMFVRRFEERFPDVALRLDYHHPDRVYDLLLSEQVDLGLVSYPRRRGDFVCLPWQNQPMSLIVAASHLLASSKLVPPTALEGCPFYAFTPELPIRREIDSWLRKHRVRVDLKHEFDNIEVIKQAVEAGPGVAILPLATVAKEVAHGTLVAIPLGGEPLHRPLGIIHKKGRTLSPAARKFIELLPQELGLGTRLSMDTGVAPLLEDVGGPKGAPGTEASSKSLTSDAANPKPPPNVFSPVDEPPKGELGNPAIDRLSARKKRV